MILPTDLQGAEANELAAAFCHELAHVRRRDFLFNLLYGGLATPLFFHPALHWILGRIVETRELACDDIAAQAVAGRRVYADNLLRLAQRMCPVAPHPTWTLGVFETEFMEKRVMNLIGNKVKPTPLRTGGAFLAGCALLAGTCTLSALLGLGPAFAQVSSQSDQAPAGWHLTGSKPESYRTGVDREMLHDSLPSAYLASTVQDTGGFGTLMQSFDASQYAGKRVRLRAWVRSKDVADWAGIWMRVDKGSSMVAFDNMQKRAIHGTRSWAAYDVVLDVPRDATGIFFGVLLSGPGKVWLNDVKFDNVGDGVATTGGNTKVALPATPVNLGFQK